MKMALKNISSRFLTVGFTADHDARFLNSIAAVGSQEGNFFYIDTGMPGYKERIKECLSESLEMVEFNDFKVTLQSDGASLNQVDGMLKYLHIEPSMDDEDDFRMEEETMKNAKFQFEKELILPKTILDDVKISIAAADGRQLEIQV